MKKRKGKFYTCPHCGNAFAMEELKRFSEFDDEEYSENLERLLKDKSIEFGVAPLRKEE